MVKTKKVLEVSEKEIEWKSAWWHERTKALWTSQGLHNPKQHLSNAQIVPPPLRGDGQTYCDKCSLLFVEYSKLPKHQQDAMVQLALDSNRCQTEYEAISND